MEKPPLNDEWLRQGAGGPVPVGDGAPASDAHRLMPTQSEKELERLARIATTNWRTGKPFHRIMNTVRLVAAVRAFRGKVPTELRWISDFYDPESPWHDPFMSIFYSLNFEDVSLNASLVFGLLRSIQLSDTPSWYSVGDELAHSLLGTQLRGVYPSDIKLPMPGFFVELPPGMLHLYNNATGDHEVRVLNVADGCVIPNPRVKGMDGGDDDPVGYGRRLIIVALCDANDASRSPEDDNIVYFSLPLFDDERTIEDLLAHDRAITGADWRDELVGGKVLGEDRTNIELRSLIRGFVVNLLLYLGTQSADVVHASEGHLRQLRKKKRTRTVRATIKRIEERPDWVVGSRIKLKPGVRAAVRKAGTPQGRSAAYNVLVRGHWRRQWRGKKTEEKPKGQEWYWRWIKPTVRNRDGGSILGHEYEVDK